jgi:hypothetical protein
MADTLWDDVTEKLHLDTPSRGLANVDIKKHNGAGRVRHGKYKQDREKCDTERGRRDESDQRLAKDKERLLGFIDATTTLDH